MKLKLYCFIVNSCPAVKRRYEEFVKTHHRLHITAPFISWAYLFLIYIKYALLHFPDRPKVRASIESGHCFSAEEIWAELCNYDVISFDIFDTLIMRPFSDPKDLFYIVGEKLDVPDFRNLRIEAEHLARAEKNKEGKSTEICLEDIYSVLSRLSGISAETGCRIEMDTELQLCRANPTMKKVWDLAVESGKKVIAASDMYLSREFIEKLLEKNGFYGFSELYVSNEKHCGKWDGKLFKLICSEQNGTIVHIGDNLLSDVRNARKQGIASVHYPNVNEQGRKFRPVNMSQLVGSAYSGIVNSVLYTENHSPAYEYGFKCGGLLILGYCGFIRERSKSFGADRILFLSRDGYIVKKVYDMLFPQDRTEYVYWSRAAASKLCSDIFPQDYIRRFVRQKSEKDFLVSEILSSMGIPDFKTELPPTSKLCGGNTDRLVSEIYSQMPEITARLKEEQSGAQEYFRNIFKNCHRAVTVDCGWAGSGNIMLEAYVRHTLGLDVSFKGLLAGSNTANQSDSDFSETYFASGRLEAYCFSSSENRNYYESHCPSKKHNVFFELLFGAPFPSCTGFDKNGPVFDEITENEKLINEIQKGELDFISAYLDIFKSIPYMLDIHGSDAYAPFYAAVMNGEKYLHKVFENAVFDELADGKKDKI